MSELTGRQIPRNVLKRELLVTVSSLALVLASSVIDAANADDEDRPTVWIELGGQLETAIGTDRPYAPGFYSPDSLPTKAIPVNKELGSHFTNGGEATITFQPEDSDWIVSASALYGRSNAKGHAHHQSSPGPWYHYNSQAHGFITATYYKLADLTTKANRSHTILDFRVGKDVGLGLFGRYGSSSINLGVRFAQFSSGLHTTLRARPDVRYHSDPYEYPTFYKFPLALFTTFGGMEQAHRSFQGIGPSLSWKAGAALLGVPNAGQIGFDWEANTALLFGRQKAAVHDHTKIGYFAREVPYNGHPRYYSTLHVYDETYRRARAVTVPDIGGSVAITYRVENFKVSAGYRADLFFGAMDTGIDVVKKSNASFYGPFAAISVGLGG
jgi:hypothetical protein